MAFMYDIRNLKDCTDYKHKREDFFRMLRLQAKLNRNAEQAILARQQMDTMGISPVVPYMRSLEDEARDTILQQKLARKNLSQIMKDNEVQSVIHTLSEPDMYFLNTEFGRLTQYLQGRENISADFFKRVLQRFKLYLQSTEMTGIPTIPEFIMEKLSPELRQEWQDYATRKVDPTTGDAKEDLPDLIRKTAQEAKMSEEEVKMEVDNEAEQHEVPPFPDVVAPTLRRGMKRPGQVSKQNLLTKKPRTIAERIAKRSIDEITPDDLLPPQEPATKAQKRKGSFKIKPSDEPFVPEIRPVPIETVLERELPVLETGLVRGQKRGQPDYKSPFVTDQQEKKQRTEPLAVIGVKRKNDDAVEDQARKMALQGGLTVEQARRLARQQIELAQQMYQPPQTTLPGVSTRSLSRVAQLMYPTRPLPQVIPPASTPRTRGRPRTKLTLEQAREIARREIEERAEARAEELTGGEIPKLHKTMPSRLIKKNGRILGKIGAGLKSNAEVKEHGNYREFGKYMISLKNLRDGLIDVKYRSLARVDTFPRKYVSNIFVEMIEKLLDTNMLDKSIFNKLTEEEQDYFKLVAKKCDFDLAIGLGLGQTMTDSERKEYDRFEVLRGSVIAGNNSPEVLTELRQYILKFLNEKRMPKPQGHDLLYELSCLS